jgi:hypothetical protein
MGGTADAFESPVATANILGRVHQGAEIKVVGVLVDQLWLQVELPDKRTAYIPAAAIPDVIAGGSQVSAVPGAKSATATTQTSPGAPEFQATTEQFTVVTPAPVYTSPDVSAPSATTLKVGTAIQGVAKSADHKWLWVQTSNGSEAYVQMSAVAPAKLKTADTSHDDQSPSLPDHIAGRATVVTTSALIVDGQKVQLAGIRGEGADHAAQLQALIDAQGGVSCNRSGKQFTCYLPDGIDVARAALYNGAARPSGNASADYRQQADSAKSAGRGIWAQ